MAEEGLYENILKNPRICAQIDLDAVLANLKSLHRSLQPHTRVAAVVKADAYGHGAKEIAEAIEDLPYLWGYAVATPEEAYELLTDGRKKPILLLGLAFPEALEGLVEAHVRVTVSTFEAAQMLSQVAVSVGRTAIVHIKVDTGMNRIGFAPTKESVEEIVQIARLPRLRIEGIFTHFARADEADKKSANEQFRLFMSFCGLLLERGVDIPIKHCGNSASAIDLPETQLDMVRAGIALYGLWPSDEVDHRSVPLVPAMSLISHVTFVKTIPAGASVSYGGTYTAPEQRRIATIPVGYADGYARSLSNKGSVLIHGRRAPIRGRICMDQFLVDVTDIEGVRAGDQVTLLGTDRGERITMEELSSLSGRFNYEFSCLITGRVPRVYRRSTPLFS